MDQIDKAFLEEILRVIQSGPLRGLGPHERRRIMTKWEDGIWRLEGLVKEAIAHGEGK